MARHMIFHHPLPLDTDATSASGIRPLRMLEAFQEQGYEVWEVVGYTAQRRARAGEVRHAIRGGVNFEFCYSESSTMPMTMTNPNHLPVDPTLDASFFAHLRWHRVPVGQFLRDIFWCFPQFRQDLSKPKLYAALAGYQLDMWTLRHLVDWVFLPSEPMASYLNLGSTPFSALPPAHAHQPVASTAETISLFYVGGIGENYVLTELFKGVALAHDEGLPVQLTVCVRPGDWEIVKGTYEALASPAIQVVHASGDELVKYYAQANLATLYVKPVKYWEFAVPVKLFDYIGMGKPMIASDGTLSGQMVAEQGLGWSIPWRAEELAKLLNELAQRPELIENTTADVLAAAEQHTWAHRARQVAETLTALGT